MKGLFTSLVLGAMAALLVVSGACKTPGVSEQPVGVEQPSTLESQRIEEANRYSAEGVKYYRLEKWTEAISEWSKAAEIEPGEASHYWYLGHCYRQQENWDGAIASYSKAIELYPNSRLLVEKWYLSASYSYRSLCYYSKGDVSLAIIDVTEAIELDPKDDRQYTSALYSGRGMYYNTLGLTDLAVADYKTVVQLGDPGWAPKAQEALNAIER